MLLPLRAVADSSVLTSAAENSLRNHYKNGGSIVDWAIDNLEIDSIEYARALSESTGVKYLEQPEFEESDVALLRQVCRSQVAVKYGVVPLSVEKSASGEKPNKLTVAHYDPLSTLDRSMVRREVDCPIEWLISPRDRVQATLLKLYGVGAETFDDLLDKKDWEEDDFDLKAEVTAVDEEEEEASVVKFVSQILNRALQERATDIHIEPLPDDLRVRFRIDGSLRKVDVPADFKKLQSAIIARLKTMSSLDVAEQRRPQDGSARLQWENKQIDVRVATIPSVEGESMSLRLLGQEQFDLRKLEFTPRLQATVDSLLANPNGIILVTGPTGCGKSTTLFSFLKELNLPETKIVTIEDPVENKLEGVIQIAVKPDIDLTFANGLRSILRGDPNVVMVGEIRDLETAEIAVQAALTGHLVFSTLHTNDAVGGIIRLMDLGVQPFLISSAVRAFIAQRLVRRLCAECRVPADYSIQNLRDMGFPEDEMVEIYDASEKGCEACGNSGYRGRTAIYELFQVTDGVQQLLAANGTKTQLVAQAEKDGFLDMKDYGWAKVRQGVTSVDEVLKATGGG